MPVSQPKKAPLTGLLFDLSKSVPVKHMSSDASLLCFSSVHVSKPKKAPLTSLLSQAAVPLTNVQAYKAKVKATVPLTNLPCSRSKLKANVQAYKAKVKATKQASLNSTLNACLLIDTIMNA